MRGTILREPKIRKEIVRRQKGDNVMKFFSY